VKVGADSGAGLVNLAPVPIDLHSLVSIQRPQLPNDDDTRLPQERTVYQLHANLVKFKPENGKTGDQDYHLVISDDTMEFSSGPTMSPHSVIAEVVKPSCIGGKAGGTTPSAFAAQLGQVRASFEGQFPNIVSGWNEAGIPVTITAVGFFDRQHGQTGRALNGIELHPILDIQFGAGAAPVVAPSAAPSSPPAAILQNPGFENGTQGWTASPSVITTDPGEPARTGTGKAWLGGYGEAHADELCQQLSIPASATSVVLSYYLHITSEEQTTTDKFDVMHVQIRNPADAVLRNVTTYSNLLAAPGFKLKTVNLTAFKGQTVKVCFQAVEDNGSTTSFVLDDFKLVVEP
jgi:hypothetical protein